MKNNTLAPSIPCLTRESDGRKFPLTERVTTIGSSSKCRIIIQGDTIPAHVAHIVFSEGTYSIAVLNRTPPFYRNGKVLTKSVNLCEGDRLSILDDTYIFTDRLTQQEKKISVDSTPLRRFIGALSAFSRRGDSDARFELLAGMAQLLGSDAARLVIESKDNEFSTIARYPQSSGLDRFSKRAILWAKQEGTTILMHDTDWDDSRESKGSLELNRVGSVLCRPLHEGDAIRGYLYLDKKREKSIFTQADKELLDDVGPIFSDLLALYERSIRQEKTIELLQKNIKNIDAPIVFECDTMRQSIDVTVKFAATDSTILITGETGTGKELFARFIHQHSNRANNSFCAINCGALPENLIESELFGHEKGAFTGAHQKKKGLIESADHGTVFLDEIGEIPINLQVKLLRVLQESELTPIGANSTVKVDVRIIAATNRDLADAVKKGNFREDLFYRLNVLQIPVSPLRDRHRDVLLLADFFIKKYTTRFGLPDKPFSLPAQAKLLKYSWPGNIRQLENAVQKALLVSKGNVIVETDLELHEAVAKEGAATFSKTGDSSDTAPITLKEARAVAEKQCIQEALYRSEGNITIAARLLDTDRKWLTKLMKQHDITIVSK